MFKELPREPATAAGCVRAAHLCLRQGAPHGVDGIIVQLAKFFRRSAPITDVRLVPDLPIPRFHFSASVFLEAVFRPLEDEFGPLLVILRRISPTGVNLVVSRPRRPVVLIR